MIIPIESMNEQTGFIVFKSLELMRIIRERKEERKNRKVSVADKRI